MNILKHLDKNNPHHAYLIEGSYEEVMPEVKKFLESLKIKTAGNPDFCHIEVDSLAIQDARNLKSFSVEKGLSEGKKIFVISANRILLQAQNSLLKMFEEPIKDTHFFLIMPDTNSLLKTLVSRFYIIKSSGELKSESGEVERFIKMRLRDRIDFVKNLLLEPEEDEDTAGTVSPRANALDFLNALESILSRLNLDSKMVDTLHHLFKVREFLRQPGSSIKSLMESVALVVPREVY